MPNVLSAVGVPVRQRAIAGCAAVAVFALLGVAAPASGSTDVVPAPTDVTAVAVGSTAVKVTWSPARTAAVTGFTVSAYPGDVAVTAGPTATTAVVGSLANGRGYRFIVTANSPLGSSAASAPSNGVVLPLVANAVSATGNVSMTLRSDGTVWGWGNNASGQLGTGSFSTAWYPTPVAGLTGVTAISASDDHGLAVGPGGSVWAWGDNSRGELGDGTSTNSAVPVHVSGLTGVVAVAAGGCGDCDPRHFASFSLALRRDGTVWEWGDNGCGQSGTDPRVSTPSIPAPVRVPGLSNVTAIAANFAAAYAVEANGTAWTWGCTGSNGADSVVTPNPLVTNAVGVAMGSGDTVLLRADGTIWDDTALSDQGLTNVVAVAASQRGEAVRADGSLWMWWTYNDAGELGNGTTDSNFYRAPVRAAPGLQVSSVATGWYHTVAIDRSGLLWAWGPNVDGALGMGPGQGTATSPAPVDWVPGTPSAVTAVAGDASATVSWSPPATDGGSPITGYTVVTYPGGQRTAVDAATTAVTVPGLHNGSTYSFAVFATNLLGAGTASAPTAFVTPTAP